MSAAVRFLILGSLRGGILILAVLLLRVLLRKLPKRYVCLLWTAVWLRLALPFAMRSRFGLLPWLSFLDQSGAARSQIAAVPILSSEAASTGVANPVVSSVQPDWPLLIWIVGLVLLLLYAGIRFVLLKRKLREAIPLRGKLCLCDWVESPFLLGLFRPRIYLPSGVEEKDIPWITAHEEAHLRHGDPWRKLGAFLLTAVYWFQPLVWIAFFLYCRDLELACDERASRDFDADARSAYTGALLRASTSGRSLWAVPMGFGSAPLQKRIQAIRQPPQCSRWFLSLAALFSVVVLFVFTAEPTRAAQAMAETARPVSVISSEAPLPDQPETKAPESSENAKSEASVSDQPETHALDLSEGIICSSQQGYDPSEQKWFLVSDPSGEASVLLFPDGSSVVLYGEPVIICCDEETGQTFAIDPVSREGDTP